jgi:hypothetical protein
MRNKEDSAIGFIFRSNAIEKFSVFLSIAEVASIKN